MLFNTDPAIDNGSAITLALAASEAIDSELVALIANVVSLHLKLKSAGIIIGARLEEIEAHARLGSVSLVFSILARGQFTVFEEI